MLPSTEGCLMKKSLLVLGSASLGAALFAAVTAAVYYFGDYVLLSPEDQATIVAAIMSDMQRALQYGYEACKNGF